MEDFRKKCLDRNYKGECPIDGRLCSEIKKCTQGEKEVLKNYDEKMRGRRVVKKSRFGPVPYERYKDKDWIELPTKYLEYLLSAECLTDEKYKIIARQVLEEKRVAKGQLEWEGMGRE